MAEHVAEHDDDLDGDVEGQDQHPAERRIENKKIRDLEAENALLKADLGWLNADQKAAVIAGIKGDITQDAVKAKVDALGIAKPADTTTSAEHDEALAAEQRMHQVATDHTAPPPPAAPMVAMHDRIMQAGPGEIYPGSPLHQELRQAFTAAGGQFIQLDHDGSLSPS